VKLKILASPGFLSDIFFEKLLWQTFMKTDLALLLKQLSEIKPTKTDSLVKLSYIKQYIVGPLASTIRIYMFFLQDEILCKLVFSQAAMVRPVSVKSFIALFSRLPSHIE
jgi:hypothetical protein